MAHAQKLFVYGSLVHPDASRVAARPCQLHGYRRTWDVAMDNRLDLPGYKYFVDPVTGERPPCQVTFLNLTATEPGGVNGVLLELGEAELARLDRRERNYRRVDVRDALDLNVTEPVWCYMATDAGLERFRLGQAAGTAVVSAAYLRGVETAFRQWGETALSTYRSTTDPPGVPVVELRRVDLPE